MTRRRLAIVLLIILIAAASVGLAQAYRRPDLRRSILYAGMGLC
jgi:hypothetical protein